MPERGTRAPLIEMLAFIQQLARSNWPIPRTPRRRKSVSCVIWTAWVSFTAPVAIGFTPSAVVPSETMRLVSNDVATSVIDSEGVLVMVEPT